MGYCHEDYLPTRRGFDTFFGHLTEQCDHFTRMLGTNDVIGQSYDLRRNENVAYEGAGLYSSVLFEKEAITMIENFAKPNKTSPWYLQLSMTAASFPYQAPDSFVTIYDANSKSRKKKHQKDAQRIYEETVIRQAMISAADQSIGKIIQKLKTTPDWNSTVVLFLSDNGSPISEANLPFRGTRGMLLEGAVRVPAFISGPLVQQSSRFDDLVHITDIFQTILELAGAETNMLHSDGFNIWNSINGKEEFKRDTVVYNLDIDDQSPNFHLAVRQGKWKLFWGQPGKLQVNLSQKYVIELYDLEKDPYEELDIVDTNPQKVEELKNLILTLLQEMKVAYQPNRHSLAFPRYNEGLIRPGWCSSDWDSILWKNSIRWDEVFLQLVSEDKEYYLQYQYSD